MTTMRFILLLCAFLLGVLAQKNQNVIKIAVSLPFSPYELSSLYEDNIPAISSAFALRKYVDLVNSDPT